MSQTRFPHPYVLTVMSDDHPGIVAAVSRAVAGLGGSIEACSQTVLKGYFTLIMIVSLPEAMAEAELAAQVRRADPRPCDYQVAVRRFVATPYAADAHPAERFVITAFGKDQPGIVERFASYLADKEINIIDMYGDVTSGQFVLIAQVEVPRRWALRLIQEDLQEVGRECGFTVRFQHENIFVATNQLRLPQSQG